MRGDIFAALAWLRAGLPVRRAAWSTNPASDHHFRYPMRLDRYNRIVGFHGNREIDQALSPDDIEANDWQVADI